MRLNQLAAVSFVLITAAAACTTEEENLSTGTHSVVVDNRIAFNRIAFNRIAFNRIAFNRIAFNRIISFDDAADLLDTPQDRELFSFIVTCAIPQGVVLTAHNPNTNEDFTFLGEVGLAPAWQTRALNGSERRWVTACLLARVNNNDVTVQISMRGPHDELTADATEKATYSLEEGAFFGDVFTDPNGDIEAYACRGRAQAAGEPTSGPLADRDCTEPDPANPGKTLCGMFYAGDCADFAPPVSTYACRAQDADDGFYTDCAQTPLFGGDDDDDDDDDDNGHGHGNHGHGHHWGWDHGGGHRSHDHGHTGNGLKNCNHQNGGGDHDVDTTSEVITTFLRP
ncbi:hypothetical protein BH11MYX2_BH11MYX2_29940 [soil metagenome]